jgi:hypothetical protein
VKSEPTTEELIERMDEHAEAMDRLVSCNRQRKEYGLAVHAAEIRADLRLAAARLKELDAIVGGLPKTADGVPVTIGMRLWPRNPAPDDAGALVEGYSVVVHDPAGKGDGIVTLDEDDVGEETYSTPEAAEAARRKG